MSSAFGSSMTPLLLLALGCGVGTFAEDKPESTIGTFSDQGLEFQIQVDQVRVKPDSTLNLRLVVFNRTHEDIYLPITRFDGGFSATPLLSWRHDGELLVLTGESSNPAAQVMHNPTVGKNRFFCLRAGKSRVIAWQRVTGMLKFKGETRSKEDYGSAVPSTLPVGEHFIEFQYSLQAPPEIDRTSTRFGFDYKVDKAVRPWIEAMPKGDWTIKADVPILVDR